VSGKLIRHSYYVLGILLCLASLIAGCSIVTEEIYNDGIIEIGGDGNPIQLINNPDAHNPTYAELLDFIIKDRTDANTYVAQSYVCSDFAEDVHNNAEAAGIRAAWVSIKFAGTSEGHALNAFETTDKGLIYIDCTGDSLEEKMNPASLALVESKIQEATALGLNNGFNYDTLAYLETGKEYGLIDITKAKSQTYAYYEQYKATWHERNKLLNEYNQEVMAYNEEVRGKSFRKDSTELVKIEAWEASLDDKRTALEESGKDLGHSWFEPPGIVNDIKIHWD